MTDASGEARVKHLEFLQSTITRLANNSFLIRGWAITLTSALVGISIGSGKSSLAIASAIPVIGFWFLDFFYLRQERLFRKLYDAVSRGDSAIPLFSMEVAAYRALIKKREVLFSPTLYLFYAPLLAVNLAVFFWI
ncbi:hypothetical protein OG458_28525 [Streptomyces sp. NBC_01281]|uniref:hypothetical protein n=1 Tax=Streptomyces sp. NBC_01281 TaxID=2903811 RepID=UPI002E12CE20|nr:hypothetical protein OG458_28525 [Streptomyces sp. NBC_01281]